MNTPSKEKNPTRQDEIDLLELFRYMFGKISDFFKALFNFLLHSLIFLIRKSPYLVIFAIIGMVIGYIIFSNTKRYYSSELVAQPNGITNADMISYINDLHQLCKENNYPALAGSLGLPDTTAKKIKDVQAFWIVDVNKDGVGDYVDYNSSFNLNDTTHKLLQDRFQLKVELFDNTTFGSLKEGLFNYISKNPYLQKLNQIRKSELTELIGQTQHEITKLDSLQDVEYFRDKEQPTIKENQLSIVAQKETQLYYRDKLSLVNKKQEYDKELELSTQPLTIIKDFTSLSVAANPVSKYLKKYGLIFLIFGLLILIFIEYRKQIMKIFREG